MKKTLHLFIVSTIMIVTAVFMTMTASAYYNYDYNYNTTDEGIEYYTMGSEAYIMRYNGSNTNIYIPDKLDGCDVVEIQSEAFQNSNMKSIRLPNKLKTICSYAFRGCTELKSIVLPNSLEYVQEFAFDKCYSLEEVVMGDNVNFQYDAFCNCGKIKDISISKSMNRAGTATVFGDCHGIRNMYLRGDSTDFDSTILDSINVYFISKKVKESVFIVQPYPDNTKYLVAPLKKTHSLVTFDTNGGDTKNTKIYTLTGQMVSEEIPPEKDDCVFDGWYTNKKCTGKAWDFTTDRVYENMTLYAKWKPMEYAVNFDTEGGKCSTKKKDYSYGLKMGELPTATRKGYNFIGWFSRSDAEGELYTSDTIMPRSDITLYAGWLKEGTKVKVYFDANGGKCTVKKLSIKYNKSTSKLPTPEYIGKKFLGWNTAVDGSGTYYDKKTKFIYNNITLYAIWESEAYTLTFDSGKDDIPDTNKKIEYNKSIGKLPELELDGYTFDGWYYSNGKKASSTDKMPAKKITLKARWIGFEYSISLDAQKGKVDNDILFISCGSSVGNLPTPTRKGYYFIGWFTKPNGKGVAYTDKTIMPEEDITLYACWEKVSEYASEIKLSKSKITLGTGQTYNVEFSTTPEKTLDSFKWTSSDSSVATVSKDGIITAKSAGTATIKVTTSKKLTASIKVTVKKGVEKISMPYTERKVKVGQSIRITPKTTGYTGTLQWSSSNSKIATVDKNGNVKILKKGTVDITVKAYNGVSATVKLVVN